MHMQKANPEFYAIIYRAFERTGTLDVFLVLCVFCFVFLCWIYAAELQFAFICFLIENVYDAFEHWKRLLNILCRSEDAIGKYQDLYINLISVLYHQLGEIPADFFVDIISQDNFLTSTLQVRLWLSLEKWEWEERAYRTPEQIQGEATKAIKLLLSCVGNNEPI